MSDESFNDLRRAYAHAIPGIYPTQIFHSGVDNDGDPVSIRGYFNVDPFGKISVGFEVLQGYTYLHFPQDDGQDLTDLYAEASSYQTAEAKGGAA